MKGIQAKPYYNEYIPCKMCDSVMRLSGCMSMGFIYKCGSCGYKSQRELYPERAYKTAIESKERR